MENRHSQNQNYLLITIFGVYSQQFSDVAGAFSCRNENNGLKWNTFQHHNDTNIPTCREGKPQKSMTDFALDLQPTEAD